jgi:hypothetical protein
MKKHSELVKNPPRIVCPMRWFPPRIRLRGSGLPGIRRATSPEPTFLAARAALHQERLFARFFLNRRRATVGRVRRSAVWMKGSEQDGDVTQGLDSDGRCPGGTRVRGGGGRKKGRQGVERQIGRSEGRARRIYGFARLQVVGLRGCGEADEGDCGTGFCHLAGRLQEGVHFRHRCIARRGPVLDRWQDPEVLQLHFGHREQRHSQRPMEAGELREV